MKGKLLPRLNPDSILHRLFNNPIAIILAQITLILALSRLIGVLFRA